MWARLENNAVAEIIIAPRSIEVAATVAIYTPTPETRHRDVTVQRTREVQQAIPDTDPVEYETVTESYEETITEDYEEIVNVETQGPGTLMIPAAAFTAWSVEELSAKGIVPASYGDSAPSAYHAATGETWAIVDGAAVGTRTWSTPVLSTVKDDLIRRVRADASRVRDKYRTPGKDLVYAEKKDQAHAVIDMGEEAANALPNNGAATYPLLAGTVGIEAPTLYALAQLVWQTYEQWNALSFVIERTEIGGCRSISDASDVASTLAAYEAITWAV